MRPGTVGGGSPQAVGRGGGGIPREAGCVDSGASDRSGHVRVSARERPQARRTRSRQGLQRGRRRGGVLLLLHDRSSRQAPGPGLPGHGLLRAWRQGGARRLQGEAGHRRRADDARPDVLARSGRCFGACGLAPAIMVDDDVHHRVKPGRISQILAQYSETKGEQSWQAESPTPTP